MSAGKRRPAFVVGDRVEMPVVRDGQPVRTRGTVTEVLPGDELDGGAVYVILADGDAKPYRRNQNFVSTPEYGIRKVAADVLRCESGWTGDRCTKVLDHKGPHSNERRRS